MKVYYANQHGLKLRGVVYKGGQRIQDAGKIPSLDLLVKRGLVSVVDDESTPATNSAVQVKTQKKDSTPKAKPAAVAPVAVAPTKEEPEDEDEDDSEAFWDTLVGITQDLIALDDYGKLTSGGMPTVEALRNEGEAVGLDPAMINSSVRDKAFELAQGGE